MPRAALLTYLSAFLITCDQPIEKTQQMTLDDIRTVMQRHIAALMAIPGVTGVAISELEDKTPCIWVMVLEDGGKLRSAIPDSLEGHPVRIVVSGEIKPLK